MAHTPPAQYQLEVVTGGKKRSRKKSKKSKKGGRGRRSHK